jgi:excinuclease ABC subunit C
MTAVEKKNTTQLEAILQTLPQKPGVYQYFDDSGTIIYVGKAKNLKKRVLQYFQKDHENAKVRVLVRKITDIQFIVVDTEIDALLLENNLIKKYQPRYNILLKDDKTYPWICIKNEPFPRIISTRNRIKDGSKYFGPYPSHRTLHALMEMIQQLFPLRTCNLNLTQEKIDLAKYKVCLEYHIKRCSGPCVNLQTEESYLQNIQQIENIIKGNVSSVIKQMYGAMMNFAHHQEFEKAQLLKIKMESLQNYQSKSLVVNPNIENVEVYGVVVEEDYGYINHLRIVNGAIVGVHTIEIKKRLDESPSELLTLAIADSVSKNDNSADELIVAFKPDFCFPNIKYTIPIRGDKKKLLEMSERNIKFYILDKKKQAALVDPERHSNRIMQKMKQDIGLKVEPRHIECFDNSNIQGTNAVAAMVCFRDGKPFKNDYRHYNIKTVVGPDDYASMREVVFRRYSYLTENELPLPNLIVIDGGKGQLGAALESLTLLNIADKIEIIGIAKRLEEIYKPHDPIPLYIDKKSESLHVIQHIRDEAHRFGITHHRNKRDKSTLKTELTEIEGIGPVLAEKLLTHFRSVAMIKKATLETIEEVIPKAKASLVYAYFQKENL